MGLACQVLLELFLSGLLRDPWKCTEVHLAVLVMELCGIASTLAAMFRRHPESLIEMMMDLF